MKNLIPIIVVMILTGCANTQHDQLISQMDADYRAGKLTPQQYYTLRSQAEPPSHPMYGTSNYQPQNIDLMHDNAYERSKAQNQPSYQKWQQGVKDQELNRKLDNISNQLDQQRFKTY